MDAFRRFRPISHFIAPHSWSNDPCGALYIPETQDYLLCYQWNPGTTVGGNCAWGMARSKDLTIWEDCPPALWNGTTYDRLGVFSGSIVSRVIQGQRTLFLFYTSVSALPIHWSKPYLQGCESQSVAISTDYGRSWHRSSANPLISAPPRESATTGWRDPFVSQWPSMSTLLGRDHKTNYMMIASGERDVGPQLHMYVSDDMVSWDYLSAVLGAQAGSNVSSNSSFSWGVNFECASFFTLGTTDYIIVGAEESNTSTRHNGHYLLWLSGTLVLRDGKPRFEVISHGVLDSGLLYAAHIFRDAQGRLLQLGWADETAKSSAVRSQGWAGCFGHPRELFQLSRPIEDVGSSQQWTVDEPSGQMTTLGIRPAPQVTALRSPTFSSLETFNMIQSTNFEVEAQFSNLSGNETFIFNVRASPDFKEVSRIIVDLGKKQISIDRSQSSLAQIGTQTPDVGHFDLLPGEDLDIRFFVDNSIVEVYANERFAMTSRIYPSLDTSIRASYDFGWFNSNSVLFKCWEGLRSSWPARDAGFCLLEELHPLRVSPKVIDRPVEPSRDLIKVN